MRIGGDLGRYQVSVKYIPFFLLISIAIAAVGCRSAQLEFDQKDMRETLLTLYENQVLDNLVRTKLHYPIVQVDYSNLTGTITQSASATLGQTNTVTRNSFLNATGALIRRVFTYVTNVGGSAAENAQLTVTGQPLINGDNVYQAYVDAIAKDPCIVQSLEAIPNDPCLDQQTTKTLEPGKYHLVHNFRGKTWYVPKEKARDFFKLYLYATVQRQTKVLVLTVDTTILDAVDFKGDWSIARPELLVRLNDKVLKDFGQMTIFGVEGMELKFRYQADPDPTIQPGHPTDRVQLIYDEDNAKKVNLKGRELVKAIAGKKARLKNDTYIPGFVAPVPNPLEPIRSQQELLRLQQLQQLNR